MDAGWIPEKSLLPVVIRTRSLVTVRAALSLLPSVPHNGLLVHETPPTFSEELSLSWLRYFFISEETGRLTSVFPVLKRVNPLHTLQP